MLAMMESKLVKQSKTLMLPPEESHQVYFIDDIHMTAIDQWND